MKKQTKIILISFGVMLVSPILHNLIYALFGFEEPVFFLLTFIAALIFLISLIYSLVCYLKKKIKKSR